MTAKKVKQEVVEQKIASNTELSKDEKQAVMEGEIIETPAADTKVEPVVEKTEEKVSDEKSEDKSVGEKTDESGEEVADEASKDGDETGDAPKKEPEEKAEEKKPSEDEWKSKAEKELTKPEGMEDLSGFTPKEKGLFYELRRQRRRAQRAEAERKEAEHQLIQNKAKEEKDEDVDLEAESKKIFEGKQEDDLLTVAEAKKILTLAGKRKTPKVDMRGTDAQIRAIRFQVAKIDTMRIHPDAEQVLSFTDELFDNDSLEAQQAREEVREAYHKGGNFVAVMYNLIKAHPKFPELEKRIPAKGQAESRRKDPDLEDRNKRATKLAADRTKTTGGAGGGGGRAEEITLEEASKLSPEEFGKLPEKVRKRLLYG